MTDAIVIRLTDYGESDRIVTLLTERHGKVTAIAKGARRSRKRFGGALCLKKKQTKKITTFKDFDCKFPSHNGQWIVFENGGYIYNVNATTDQFEKVNISIQEDFVSGRNKYIQVKDNIGSWDIGSDGNRAVFSARGDIFTVPAKNGVIRNLTKSSGAHDRDPAWSPNGKYIAYISDASGEDEVYLLQADGTQEACLLYTSDAADERSSVDLGGRRIIKKKNNKQI